MEYKEIHENDKVEKDAIEAKAMKSEIKATSTTATTTTTTTTTTISTTTKMTIDEDDGGVKPRQVSSKKKKSVEVPLRELRSSRPQARIAKATAAGKMVKH